MDRRSNNLFNFLTRPRILLCLSAQRKTNQRTVCLHKTYPKMSITKALTQSTQILCWALLTPQLRWQFYHWLMLACTFYTRANSQRTDKLQRIFNHLQFLDTLKFTIYEQFHLPCRTIWRESVAAVRTRATGRSRASAADRSTCRAAWTRTSTEPVSTDRGSHPEYSAAKYLVSVNQNWTTL